MSQRTEFVLLAKSGGISVSELAQRFGISRKTAHKWLAREAAGESMANRSRRPQHSPRETDASLAKKVVTLRQAHPCWGGRKLRRVLLDRGHESVPAASTISHILRRHGLLQPPGEAPSRPWQRFEHAAPNDLWQMDFKGTVSVGMARCDPLTVLDDHSRYNVILQAVSDMRTPTVQAALTDAFRRYGLPVRMNMDNGAPWGSPREPGALTMLGMWLVRLGIRISFSAPAHPQTNGKEERFHRSLKAEVLNGRAFHTFAQLQASFDRWRETYNCIRPHEGIGLATPATRYRPSPRAFPEALPAIEYAPQDVVLKVTSLGRVRFKRHRFRVSKTLEGCPIALRPDELHDGRFNLYFAHHRLGSIDLDEPA